MSGVVKSTVVSSILDANKILRCSHTMFSWSRYLVDGRLWVHCSLTDILIWLLGWLGHCIFRHPVSPLMLCINLLTQPVTTCFFWSFFKLLPPSNPHSLHLYFPPSRLTTHIKIKKRQCLPLLKTIQDRAANKVYESTLFPLKSKSSPLSTPYPASTTLSTRLTTSSSWASRSTRIRSTAHTGGEGLWKWVFTCWEHFRLWQKVLPMFQPDTFHSHFKCNVNICLQCDCQ